MLQIRLSKGSSTDNAATAGGCGADGTASVVGAPSVGPGPAEGVTVACPDHLVIADLPVAKSIGAVTASATSAARTIGRRSRRPLGERVHICSRCDFPIAMYGRLVSTIPLILFLLLCMCFVVNSFYYGTKVGQILY
jgi:E3 ubiquitin-protein ligase Hakai